MAFYLRGYGIFGSPQSKGHKILCFKCLLNFTVISMKFLNCHHSNIVLHLFLNLCLQYLLYIFGSECNLFLGDHFMKCMLNVYAIFVFQKSFPPFGSICILNNTRFQKPFDHKLAIWYPWANLLTTMTRERRTPFIC